jgi:hypothetical protein
MRLFGVCRLKLAFAGTATFIVNNVRCPQIDLPVGAVCVPAVCFLKMRQKITISVERLANEEISATNSSATTTK